MSKPTILVAEDDAAIRLVISQTLTADGYSVRTTASPEALQRWVRDGEGDAVVTDVYLDEESIFDIMPGMRMERPELPFIVMSGQNTILTAASAAEHGAFDYLPKPFDIEVLSGLISRALNKSSNSLRRIDRETRKAERDAVLPLIGRSETMQDVYRVVSRVMNTDLTVLIEGEPGTGKELAARAIHDLGQGNTAPFIPLELGGLPDSELSAAFDALHDEKHATIYIDEIADLSSDAQARLIHLVKRSEHARLIVATQYDLDKKVIDGEFRRDLFYRLNVVRLILPSLSDRSEDIPELAKAFLIRARDQGLPAKQLDQSALDAFQAYHWPGNVRELENIILRLCVLSPDNLITAKDFEQVMRTDLARTNSVEEGFEAEVDELLQRHLLPHLMSASVDGDNHIHQQIIEQVERPLIKLALSVTSGNKVRAATLLGVNRNTLRAKMKALDLADK